MALLHKCVEILEPVKSKPMKEALARLTELLARFQQMDGKRRSVGLDLPIVRKRLEFCFHLDSRSSNSSPRSCCRGGRHRHLSCQEPSKENRSFPAAEGLLFSLRRDTTSSICRDGFISRRVLQTLLEMKESRRAKKLSPFELLRNDVLEFINSLVK